MYLSRYLFDRFQAYLGQFPCLLLLGARQVGKSTFLAQALKDWRLVDLEDPGQAALVQQGPDLFLRDHPQNIWFDEAQRVPELFAALRVAIDRDRRPGRYVISGSASPALMRDVSESLAGRVGILHLGPFTAAEQMQRPQPDFLRHVLQTRTIEDLLQLLSDQSTLADPDVRKLWLRGGYPEPALMDDSLSAWRWFDSYTRTISERDLQQVAQGLTPVMVDRLLQMIAARHGQSLNISAFASDLGITPRTAGVYLDALEGTFLMRRLSPYLANIGKRLVKSPKACIIDSGLLHHLLRIYDLETLEMHPLMGASWEGWVGEQLIRQAEQYEPTPAVYHWRTQAGAEVDLVLEAAGGRLIPIEIKHTARVNPFAARGLRQFLTDFKDRAPFGVIIYRGKVVARLAENILMIPVERVVF
ncbi:MAG: putative AAA+ superfamily ATPase [Candidatus Latescibacterota bacterium]|jgi:predicted AAA+ superfamily ATPase